MPHDFLPLRKPLLLLRIPITSFPSTIIHRLSTSHVILAYVSHEECAGGEREGTVSPATGVRSCCGRIGGGGGGDGGGGRSTGVYTVWMGVGMSVRVSLGEGGGVGMRSAGVSVSRDVRAR
jgi:hypothetical protein